MINSMMKTYIIQEERVAYDSLGIEIKEYVDIGIIKTLIKLRGTEDKMLDTLLYEKANYNAITHYMTVCKDNMLVKGDKKYKVVEVFKHRNTSQLFLKEVNI